MMDRILAWFLGGAFVLAGALKSLHPDAFEKALHAMKVVPASAALPIALWLPLFEILCGAVVLVGFWRRAGLLGCSILGLVFVAVLGFGIWKGNPGSCGCFGAWDPFAGKPWLSLGRAGAFLILSVVLYVRSIQQ